MTYAQLQQRLDRGNVLILDGATGTELQRCGASEAIGPRSADPGSGYIAAPDWRFVDVIDAGALREFQENWLLAGARRPLPDRMQDLCRNSRR